MHPEYAKWLCESHEARFFSKVRKEESGCWVWTGHRYPKGYGAYKAPGGRLVSAHRASYEMHNGPVPAGVVVCHRCDNPPCVNPNHLWLGTAAENNADRDAKGRQVAPKGSRHGMASITDETAREIRAACASGEPQVKIAKRLSVSKYVVNSIATGRNWTHIV